MKITNFKVTHFERLSKNEYTNIIAEVTYTSTTKKWFSKPVTKKHTRKVVSTYGDYWLFSDDAEYVNLKDFFRAWRVEHAHK